MYKLYFYPGACSLATQVILRELGEPFELLHAGRVKEFKNINSSGQVPVLVDGSQVLTEGAAIILYLLDKHKNHQFYSSDEVQRHTMIENMLFANATLHPAYSKMFFIEQNISDVQVKNATHQIAADKISSLWAMVEGQLSDQPFLGGSSPSPADILMAVYSRWGAGYKQNIVIGEKTQAMIEQVIYSSSFQAALKAEDQIVEAA